MKVAVITALICLGSYVYAQEMSESTGSQSQYYRQALEGHHLITPFLDTVARRGEVRSSGADVESRGAEVGVSYEYGISNLWAVGAEIASATLEDDVDNAARKTESKGMKDLEVTVRGQTAAGSGLHFGGRLSIAVEDSEIESNGDSNSSSGGNVLAPYIGYQWALPTSFIGVQLTRELQLGKAKQTDKSSGTKRSFDLEGGELTTLAAFYEAVLSSNVSLGTSLELSKRQDIEVSGDLTGTVDGKSATALVVYVPIQVGGGTLIPRLSAIKADTAVYKDNRIATVGVGYRIEF